MGVNADQPRVYAVNDETQIVVSKGANPAYLHFGITADKQSGHFTLTVKNGAVLESALAQACAKKAKRR